MNLKNYLGSYPDSVITQVELLLKNNRLGDALIKRYPTQHEIACDSQLRDYALQIKNRYLQKSSPVSKIVYDSKIHTINNALGLHTYISRAHGGKLKSKNEIRISSLFKSAPEQFLQMIITHELAHLKEKDHNKAFYRLCQHMLPNYHQLEFDTRLYLIQLEVYGPIYNK